MSLVDQYSQNILGYRGTLLEAQDLFKAFIAELLIQVFNVEQRLQQQVFRNCNKSWPIVQENLRNYFKNSGLPIQTIFNENKYKNEGFLSSDEEEGTKQGKQKVKITRTKSIIKEQQKNAVDFKDEQIKIRDKIIEDMTIGYYKDLQHLKEMFLKKEKQQDDDIFDATYYDITKSFPPEVQFYIQQKLKEASNQAKQQQTKFQQTISQQQNEIDKLRKTINQIVAQTDVQQQIKSILLLDKDLYRFWKGIQDVIGNKQIFELFEKRMAGYGIDYKQIDELISHSQASNRVLIDFKAKIDEQYILFTTQVQKELQQYRNQIKILNDKQNGVEQEKEKDYIQIRQTIKAGIEHIYEMKEATIKSEYAQKLEEQAEKILNKDLLKQVKRCVKGHALYKWMYLAKCEKMQWQKKLRRTQSTSYLQLDISCNPRGLLDTRISVLKKQLLFHEVNLQEEQAQNQQLAIELNQMKNKHSFVLMNYEMQLHKSLYMQQQLVWLENQNKYFEKIFTLLMRRIGYSQFEVNSKNIHILLEKVDVQMRSFWEKINKIQDKSMDDITEMTNQLFKKTIISNSFQQFSKSNCFAQTDIFDISIKLEDCIKNAHLFQQKLSEMEEEQKQLLKQQQLEQEKENQCDDIPNILLSDEEGEKEAKLKNKVSFERSTEIDTTNNNQINFDVRDINHPQTADNRCRAQQFTFESRKRGNKPSTRNKEVQTEIQVCCRANLVNKIFINDLEEFKKNVKEKSLIRENKRQPLQTRPEVQSTFATLISQHNASKVRKQQQTNLFLQTIRHKPIEINCQPNFKTEISGEDLLSNITFTNDRIKVVYTPNKNKVRSVSKNV